ncbi:MAG TPA: hypothetical protein VNR20_04835 [Terriglobales bacterium]|nr:hypothetical protein [Terriglobales bacterium]
MKIYKVLRWVVLAALIIVVVFALKKPAPPAPPLAPQAVKEQSQQFESKLQQIETAERNGNTPEPETTTFTSNEVNAFIQDASERARAEAAKQPTLAEAQAEVKDTQVAFSGNEVIAQAVTVRYGQDVYVTVRGRLGADNGYLRFYPTGFKIGDLSVPVSLVDPTLQKKLNEPETHEKLKLPDFVQDLRIENSQLVMVPK